MRRVGRTVVLFSHQSTDSHCSTDGRNSHWFKELFPGEGGSVRDCVAVGVRELRLDGGRVCVELEEPRGRAVGAGSALDEAKFLSSKYTLRLVMRRLVSRLQSR